MLVQLRASVSGFRPRPHFRRDIVGQVWYRGSSSALADRTSLGSHRSWQETSEGGRSDQQLFSAIRCAFEAYSVSSIGGAAVSLDRGTERSTKRGSYRPAPFSVSIGDSMIEHQRQYKAAPAFHFYRRNAYRYRDLFFWRGRVFFSRRAGSFINN